MEGPVDSPSSMDHHELKKESLKITDTRQVLHNSFKRCSFWFMVTLKPSIYKQNHCYLGDSFISYPGLLWNSFSTELNSLIIYKIKILPVTSKLLVFYSIFGSYYPNYHLFTLVNINSFLIDISEIIYRMYNVVFQDNPFKL